MILVAVAWAGTEQLKLRDPVPCVELGEPTIQLRDELLALTDPALEPSWIPVRAADCLVELYAADPVVAEAMLPWMTDPGRAGLALVVVNRLELFPVEVAVRLARAGMSAADERQRSRVERRLKRSKVPELRAIVDAPELER